MDINGFAPVTFDEMVENNRRHKKESLELAQSRAEALVELKGKELLRADDELAEAESALEELLTVPEYEKVKDMIERYAACKTKAESQKFAYDFLRGYMNVDGPSAEVLLVDTFDDDFGCVINSAMRHELTGGTENLEAVMQFVRNYYTTFNDKTLHVAVKDIEYHAASPLYEVKNKSEWLEIQSLLRTELERRGERVE